MALELDEKNFRSGKKMEATEMIQETAQNLVSEWNSWAEVFGIERCCSPLLLRSFFKALGHRSNEKRTWGRRLLLYPDSTVGRYLSDRKQTRSTSGIFGNQTSRRSVEQAACQ